MLALNIILAHLVGDYLIQSQWMADEKVKRWWPAIVHGVTYTVPYLFVTQSFWALLIICVTHIVIDRYRLAKRVVWAKNWLFAPKGAKRYSWEECKETGFPPHVPPFMAVWLMIIVDNTIHLVINTAAILIFGV